MAPRKGVTQSSKPPSQGANRPHQVAESNTQEDKNSILTFWSTSADHPCKRLALSGCLPRDPGPDHAWSNLWEPRQWHRGKGSPGAPIASCQQPRRLMNPLCNRDHWKITKTHFNISVSSERESIQDLPTLPVYLRYTSDWVTYLYSYMYLIFFFFTQQLRRK